MSHSEYSSVDGAERCAYVAVDIGASSGRVMLGRMEGPAETARVALQTVHRFPNGVVDDGGALSWDLEGLWSEVLRGLRLAASVVRDAGEKVGGIGIDTWAVDYGLLRDGQLIGAPRAYRDSRSDAGVEAVHSVVPFEELYAVTGMQFLPFNTLYQLATEPDLAGLQALLIPDLLAYRLTGALRTEETNASTTGLLDAFTGRFSTELFDRLGLESELFPPLISPGDSYGSLLPQIAVETGLDPATSVIAVGSHDTASAVAAVPAVDGIPFAYISSGTWSLLGVELDAPVTTTQSRQANFTNERGVDGTIRYLRNVGGLWLLQECLRQWEADGLETGDLPRLLEAAEALPSGGPRVDADADEFLAPGNMPQRLRAAAGACPGQQLLGTDPAAVVRCIMDSLADGYAEGIRSAVDLGGVEARVLHVVGGGSQNSLLCQLTANATGLPVVAGPVEATALGNVLVQARADAGSRVSLFELRAIIRRSVETETYAPCARPVD